MEEEGFIGLDKGKCTSQLNQWVAACKSVNDEAKKVLELFNNALVFNWYSPAAAEQNMRFRGKCCGIGDCIYEVCIRVGQNAIGSIRYLAIKNHDSFNPEIDFSVGGRYNWADLHEGGPYGEGMNKKRVTENIIPDFRAGMERVIASLDELPMDLAVYDEAGNILATYKDLIDRHKKILSDKVAEIVALITDVINSEVDNLKIGVVESTNRMAA